MTDYASQLAGITGAAGGFARHRAWGSGTVKSSPFTLRQRPVWSLLLPAVGGPYPVTCQSFCLGTRSSWQARSISLQGAPGRTLGGPNDDYRSACNSHCTVLTPVTPSCVASTIPCPLKAVRMSLLWNHGKFLDSVMKMTGNKMEPSAPSYNGDCAFSFHGTGVGGCP